MRPRSYSLEFFELQLRFAQKVSEVAGIDLAEATGRYTNLYVRLAMGTRYDATNPQWCAFVRGLLAADDRAAWAYAAHSQRLTLPTGPVAHCAAGCFSLAFIAPDRARLHFDPLPHAASLGRGSIADRARELASLFTQLQGAALGAPRIVGASWLYHLPAYRSLFPPSYLSAMSSMPPPYDRMPLWGQLLARDGSVRADAGARFRTRLAGVRTVADLRNCFALPVLTAEAPAQVFYDHLRVAG